MCSYIIIVILRNISTYGGRGGSSQAYSTLWPSSPFYEIKDFLNKDDIPEQEILGVKLLLGGLSSVSSQFAQNLIGNEAVVEHQHIYCHNGKYKPGLLNLDLQVISIHQLDDLVLFACKNKIQTKDWRFEEGLESKLKLSAQSFC